MWKLKTKFMRLMRHFIFFLIFISSCTYLPPIGKKYQKPQNQILQKWHNFAGKERLDFGEIEESWWHNFGDAKLSEIIKIAIKNNSDLKIAHSRIIAARSNLKISESKLAPSVAASSSATRRNNFINPINPSDRTLFNLFTAGFDVAWEIDLFGANYRSKKAAQALYEASQAEKNYVLISLIAEVAKNYSEFRLLQNNLNLQKKILANYQEILQLKSQLKNVGLISDSDLAQAQISYLNQEAEIAETESKFIATSYNLDNLLGLEPGEISSTLEKFEPIPIISRKIIINAPTNIIASRPDIIQAEKEFVASWELENYAIAQIFPKISLSSFFGFYNTKSGKLITPSSKAFSLGADFKTPILDFGGVFAGMKKAKEEKNQSLITYEAKIKKALSEVNSNINIFVKKSQKFSLMNEVVKNSSLITKLAYKRYLSGNKTYENFLSSEIDSLKLQKSENDTKYEYTLATISLYKSLGGGWKEFVVDKNK